MLIQAQAGGIPNIANKSGQNNCAAGWLNEILVSELAPNYSALAQIGLLFSTAATAVTLAATHASPIAAGTGTPIISIFNPANSGKNLHLIKMLQATTSGTPGGPLVWNLIPNPANITATSAAPFNTLSLSQAGSVARCWNNTALTGSTAGTAFRTAGGAAAAAVTGTVLTFVEEFKGSIIIPPGSMLALAATAAGTTHIISAFAEWAELPI